VITIHSIGHSNHPLERFLALLGQHAIEALVDVRSVPYSKHAPQYRKRALQEAVAARGLTYLQLGQELGGTPRAAPPVFQAGLERLLSLAAQRRVVIMCAEEDPARCHRSSLIAAALRERGAAVMHLRGDGRSHLDGAVPAGTAGQPLSL